MSHGRAVLTMVLVTLLWSIAGVVTRQLEAAQTFEITFWRSAANALALGVILTMRLGLRPLLAIYRHAGRTFWASAVCWSVMFTAFMVALTLTTVANVLVTMALVPVATAVVAHVFLHHRQPLRTWLATLVAGAGIAWMFGSQAGTGSQRDVLGIGVALLVPAAGSVQWVLQQHNAQHRRGGQGGEDLPSDMTPAILVGALLSAAVTAPLAWPFQGTVRDVAWLSMLGMVQLAIPCLLAVKASRVLKAPEVALLGLLETLFGVSWTWLAGQEHPSASVLGGGALVLGALAINEVLTLVRGRRAEPVRTGQTGAAP